MRKKIAIVIDSSLRIPNFKDCYTNFRSSLFTTETDMDDEKYGFGDEIEALNDIFTWKKEMQKEDVFAFYQLVKVKDLNDVDVCKNDSYSDYFYNKEHMLRFFEEHSFNLYIDCDIPNKKDIENINICHRLLFDVHLIDLYNSNRKIQNTLFFMSKLKLVFKSIVFLIKGTEDKYFEENDFVGVWNPIKNKAQINKEGDETFINWLKDLEKLNAAK